MSCLSTNPCSRGLVNASCIPYTGTALLCIGATTNERLDSILHKINDAICDISAVLIFNNGLTKTSSTVQLGGTLIHNTVLNFDVYQLSLTNVDADNTITSVLGLDGSYNVKTLDISSFTTNARNGLEVTDGYVELGGTLIHDTILDFAIFDLSLVNVPQDNTAPNFLAISTDGTTSKRAFRVPLNILLAAEATNTIDSGAFTQEWKWNSMSGAPGFKITSNSPSLIGAPVGLVEISVTGSNSPGLTTYSTVITNDRTGSNSNNIALFASAHSGTYNQAAVFGGNVCIATTGIGVIAFARLDVRDGDFYLTWAGNSPRIAIGDNVTSPPGTEQYGGIIYDNVNDYLSFGHAKSNQDFTDMFIDSVGSVGIGATAVDASAIFQIDSVEKGFVPPRMTEAQRLAIPSPKTSLMVYQIDGVEGYYYKSSTAWIQL